LSTPEQAVASDETIRRWDLSIIKEHIKRIWAAMHGRENDDRGPMDYPPWDDERRILIDIIRKQTRSPGGGTYNESGSPLLKWILGVLATLTVAVIVGGVSVYGQFKTLESAVTEWKSGQQRQIDEAKARLDRLENRR